MSLDKDFDRQFFATRQDQLPNLLRLEAEVKLQYVLEGMFEDPEPIVYSSASELPDLGVVKDGHYLHTPSYLVTQAGRRVIVKAIPQVAGGVLHDISLQWNITGFAFRPSGRFGRKTLIPGSVDTATGNKTSLAMCKQFWQALQQGYVKVERYYLGPEAYRFLEKGGRLTPAVQCPRNMDVVLPKQLTPKNNAAKAPTKRKSASAPRRKSLEATWKFLASEGENTPRRANGRPFVPDAMPSIEDEESGLRYYKYRLEDANNSNLTMPRSFFGRSRFACVSFANTDLSESRMCWNEFKDCDFSGADLSKCDMRASRFIRCKFVKAVLRGADLRRSGFEACDFRQADLRDAIAEDEDAFNCVQDFLTKKQQSLMAWSPDEGPEPPGG